MQLLDFIKSQLLELDKSHMRYESVARELDSFLKDYYARILHLCERLENIRHSSMCLKEQNPNLPKKDIASSQSQLKSLYRSLIKECHPDNKGGKHMLLAGDVIAAYEKKSLSGLWWLSIQNQFSCLPKLAIEHYLHAESQKISRAIHDNHECYDQLLNSPAWQLKERVWEAQLLGVNLVEQIVLQVENQIYVLEKIAA
jgi:hypothetical protein